MRSFIVAFRSAKEWKNATFAERKATLVFRTMLSSTAAITQSPPINYDLDSRPTGDLGAALCSDFHGLRGIEMVFVSRDFASATILFKSLSNLAASSRLIRRISSLIVSIVNSPRVHLVNKSPAEYIQSRGKSVRLAVSFQRSRCA